MVQQEAFPKLERQPLTVVLAEVVFSAVDRFADHAEALREALADQCADVSGYVLQPVHVAPGGVTVSASQAFQAAMPDGTGLVQVEQDRLVYVTTRYPRFAGFSAAFMALVEPVAEVLTPDALLRVGLRYNDAVVPQADEYLSQYLDGGFAPPDPLPSVASAMLQYRTEAVMETVAGELAVRSLMGIHGLSVMPDIRERFRGLGVAPAPDDRVTAVLDFDHYWKAAEGGADFAPAPIEDRLGALHGPAREAFWRVTTEFAREERWS